MANITDNVVDRDMNKEKTYHRVLHSFKEELIVPIAAITNNVDFLFNGKECIRIVKTSDGTECFVEHFEEVHMCELEADIKRLYGMEPWPYIMRWHKVQPNMHSMDFIKMKIKRYDK